MALGNAVAQVPCRKWYFVHVLHRCYFEMVSAAWLPIECRNSGNGFQETDYGKWAHGEIDGLRRNEALSGNGFWKADFRILSIDRYFDRKRMCWSRKMMLLLLMHVKIEDMLLLENMWIDQCGCRCWKKGNGCRNISISERTRHYKTLCLKRLPEATFGRVAAF